MDHYLFTDGTPEVKEAHSKEELLSMVNSSASPGRIRVWKFNTNEWLDYPAFLKQDPGFGRAGVVKPSNGSVVPPVSPKKKGSWLKRSLWMPGIAAGALLVFNFNSAGWENKGTMKIQAARPANVPVLDIDSLITEIEWQRGRSIDKGTRYNLRLRNNWPEHIFLQLNAAKESKGGINRFFNINVSIDNTTGFNLDNAVVTLQLWKKGKPDLTDTLQFNGIRYDKVLVRQLAGSFRGDSLSLSFGSVRAKAFNFCYTDDAKNNSGNPNDRWFCREGKTPD